MVIVLCIILMFPALSRLILQHEHFVKRANAKAIFLHKILETAPQAAPGTVLILAAERSTLDANDLYDFSIYDVVNSIFRVLYQPHIPPHTAFAALCLPGPWCSYPHDFIQQPSDDFIKSNLPNMLLLKINADLSVELVEQPAAYFGFDSDLTYDASRLYNPNAPLPPRAATMLGSTLRE